MVYVCKPEDICFAATLYFLILLSGHAFFEAQCAPMTITCSIKTTVPHIGEPDQPARNAAGR